ncbi:hypothetical protein EBO15_31155 [Actinomadura harenae]|uniref:Uncharacterized protein n=2 Tax=Actinomadura harenae TaxID=2483351 RepID=A0A3M2LN83_9ACTN|nr:hypothetical protein EBO15_31155 [Actinomadura harenae]
MLRTGPGAGASPEMVHRLQRAAGNGATAGVLVQRATETVEHEDAIKTVDRGVNKTADNAGTIVGAVGGPLSGGHWRDGVTVDGAKVAGEVSSDLGLLATGVETVKAVMEGYDAVQDRSKLDADGPERGVADRKIRTAVYEGTVGGAKTTRNAMGIAQQGMSIAGAAADQGLNFSGSVLGLITGIAGALRNGRKTLKALDRVKRIRARMADEGDPRGAYTSALHEAGELAALLAELAEGVRGKQAEIGEQDREIGRRQAAVAEQERAEEAAASSRRTAKKQAKRTRGTFGTRDQNTAQSAARGRNDAAARLRTAQQAKARAERELRQAREAKTRLEAELQTARDGENRRRVLFDELSEALKRYTVEVERDAAGKRTDVVTLDELRRYADKKNTRGVTRKAISTVGGLLSVGSGVAGLVVAIAAALGGAALAGTPVGWGLAAAAAAASIGVAAWKGWQFFGKRWAREEYVKDDEGNVRKRKRFERVLQTAAFWRKSGPTKRDTRAEALYQLALNPAEETFGIAELFDHDEWDAVDAAEHDHAVQTRELVAALDAWRSGEARKLVADLGLDWSLLAGMDPATAKKEIARKLGS